MRANSPDWARAYVLERVNASARACLRDKRNGECCCNNGQPARRHDGVVFFVPTKLLEVDIRLLDMREKYGV